MNARYGPETVGYGTAGRGGSRELVSLFVYEIGINREMQRDDHPPDRRSHRPLGAGGSASYLDRVDLDETSFSTMEVELQ